MGGACVWVTLRVINGLSAEPRPFRLESGIQRGYDQTENVPIPKRTKSKLLFDRNVHSIMLMFYHNVQYQCPEYVSPTYAVRYHDGESRRQQLEYTVQYIRIRAFTGAEFYITLNEQCCQGWGYTYTLIYWYSMQK